jgi:sugar phosphate isomerase/epimerase
MAKLFKIGVMTDSFGVPFAEALDKAAEVGAEGIQLYVTGGEMLYSGFTPEKIELTNKQLKEHNLVVSAVCGDFGGHGFESEEENKWKIPASKQVADLAKALGSSVVTTHIGVVPTDKGGSYDRMKAACKEIGDYAAEIGVTFAIETGPEKPETLRNFIIDVGSKGNARARNLPDMRDRRRRRVRDASLVRDAQTAQLRSNQLGCLLLLVQDLGTLMETAAQVFGGGRLLC